MNDFRPENVARQVAPLRALLDLRVRLADLRGVLLGNERLEETLYQALRNLESMSRMQGELAPSTPKAEVDTTSPAQVAAASPMEEMWVSAGSPASEEMRQRGCELLGVFLSEVLSGFRKSISCSPSS